MEECGKVEILGGYATGLLLGHEVDTRKLVAAFASHKAKNRANAYMLELNEHEGEALRRRDWKSKHEAFSKYQAEFI